MLMLRGAGLGHQNRIWKLRGLGFFRHFCSAKGKYCLTGLLLWICSFASSAAYLVLSAAGISLPIELNSGGGTGNSEALTDVYHQNDWYSHKPFLTALKNNRRQLWKHRAKSPLLPTTLGWTLHYIWDALGAVCGSSSGLVSLKPGYSCTSGQSESIYHVCSLWQGPSDRQGLTYSSVMSFTGSSPLDREKRHMHPYLHWLKPKGSNCPWARENRGTRSTQSSCHRMEE